MNKLYVLVGLPASGKTTYANNNLDAVILSSDEYREKMYGDINDQMHNSEVFDALYKDMIRLLRDSKNVCVDATNISRKSRSRIINLIRDSHIYCDIECVLFATSIGTILYRNSIRDRVVPIGVINKMLCSFELPFLGEGFDNLTIIDSPDTETSISDKSCKMINFNQNNPHHSLSLDRHCEKCWEYLMSKDLTTPLNDELKLASRIHDIGKLYTQTVDDNSGFCHYIGHDHYGSYIVLTTSKLNDSEYLSVNSRYKIAFYINYHMEPFRLRDAKEKTKFKYITQFGDEWNNIMILHEGDKNAH